MWLQLNSTQIRTQNYQNFGLTPPSGQKIFLKITIFSTFFSFFDISTPSDVLTVEIFKPLYLEDPKETTL